MLIEPILSKENQLKGNFECSIRVFHAFLSDNLRDLKLQTKINFIKNCPQWALNPQPSDHHSKVLPTETSYYLVVCMNH